ncbi:MAG TPA: fibronectin type III domain-containing protein [Patescibacteria group bacterium]|nr:fibronectin type III domain-containing protein [Patescibacteria group bacterium]
MNTSATQSLSAGPTGGFNTLTNVFSGNLSALSAWQLATGTAATSWTGTQSGNWIGLLAAFSQAATSTPPQNLAASPGNGQVALSWNAPASTGGLPLSSYFVEYKTSASPTWLAFASAGASTTTTTVNGLLNGTSYDFRVSATNPAGTSTPAVASATPALTPPNPPQNLTATPRGSAVVLAWNAPEDNNMPVDEYLVYYRLAGGASFGQYLSLPASQSAATVTGLSNGQTYDFEVLAGNTSGTSSPSNIATASPFVFSWPASNNYDGDFTNATQYIGSYITNHPSWFAHVPLVTDFSVLVSNGTSTISTTSAESTYQSTRSAIINAQGSGGQPVLVGTYISGTTVQQVGEDPNWPYARVPLEWMPGDAAYIGTWPGDPGREVVDVTSTATVQALQTNIKTLWAQHPSSLYMVDNAASNSVQGGTQPWAAQCANIQQLRQIANSQGSAVVFNVAAPPGLVSPSDYAQLMAAVGEGNAIMLEDPWDNAVRASSTLTQLAANTYRQLSDYGISVVMIPGINGQADGETLSQWVQSWRQPADAMYISGAFYLAPDPLVFGPFLPIGITSPAQSAALSGTVSLAATASSSYGSVTAIKFLLDGADLGLAAATISPNSYTSSWNTATVPNGTHVLTAAFTDSKGNTSTSSATTITTANTVAVGGGVSYSSLSSASAAPPTDNEPAASSSQLGVPAIILPTGVKDGDTIKFPQSQTIYLIKPDGLYPFDSWVSYSTYAAESSVRLQELGGPADLYTVSTRLAREILEQSPNAAAKLFPATLNFGRNLGYKNKGADVKALQQFLNQNGFSVAVSGPGAPGRETDVFGLATKAAVKNFQTSYQGKIGLPAPTGKFDTATRTFVNNLHE